MDFILTKTFWAALLMGCVCPLIGRNLILGRSIMLGIALPQVSLAGIAFVILGSNMGWAWCLPLADESARTYLGAAIFVLPALVVLARRQQLSEATLGIVFLMAVSATNLLLATNAIGETLINDLFHGRLLLISDGSFYFLAVTLILAASVALVARRRLLLGLIDGDFTLASGLRLGRWQLTTALLNGTVISVAVGTVGPVVTVGFLLLSTLSAAIFAKSLSGHLGLATIAGAAMATLGTWAAYHFDLPLGDAVVAVGCVNFGLCFALQRSLAAVARAKSRKRLSPTG